MRMPRNLIQISTSGFPTKRELKYYYNEWARTKVQKEILFSFLNNPKQTIKQKPKKISQIAFNEFDFTKKNSFQDIMWDLQINEFINWILSKSHVSPVEKVARKKAYREMFKDIVETALTASRGYTHKVFGFGAYQLKDVREQRIGTDEQLHTFRPIVLCPTRPECIDKLIGQGLNPELKNELVHRSKYLYKQFRQIKKNAALYMNMQKDILNKLDEEVGD